MAEHQALHRLAFERWRASLSNERADLLADGLGEILRDDHGLAVDVVGAVLESPDATRSPGSTGSSTASSSRSGPRPTNLRSLATPSSAGTRCASSGTALVAQRELDVDRRRGVRLVLDLGLGQRRAAMRAPVHRLLALVDHVLLDEPAERADDRRLVVEAIVRYGSSQSPRTPRRLKSLRWMSTYFAAYARHARRNSAVLICRFFGPSSRSTFSSIGRPWQSQPGTYGASKPSMLCDFTTMSLRILLSAWPMWISPFAYGGPSCSRNFFAPLRACANLAVQVHLVPAGDGFRLGRLQVRLHREGGPRQVTGVFPVGHKYPTIVH